MCRSGRLAVANSDEKAEQTLEWDDGTAWELTVKVKHNSDGIGWLVTGMLVRDDESL